MKKTFEGKVTEIRHFRDRIVFYLSTIRMPFTRYLEEGERILLQEGDDVTIQVEKSWLSSRWEVIFVRVHPPQQPIMPYHTDTTPILLPPSENEFDEEETKSSRQAFIWIMLIVIVVYFLANMSW